MKWKMAKIMIDPGHGGNDPGAVGSKSKEKDNVLKVAKKLKTLLEKYGHTVKMTRSTDVFISLTQRANMANSWGADYFISLHNNAASPSATGFETFVYNGGVSQKTKQFQNAIHSAIASKIGIRDRGKKSANFAVLRQTKMPAVLIEYAFISNVNDEKILINEVNKLAELTCDGVIDAIGGTIKAKPSKPKVKPSTPKKTTNKGKVKYPLPNGVYSRRAHGNKSLNAVKQIQSALNAANFKCGKVDGYYGAKTEDAVRRFQMVYDAYNVDGVYGKRTKTRLNKVVN